MKKVFCILALIVGIVVMNSAVVVADCLDMKVVCVKIVNGRLGTEEDSFMAGACWKEWGCHYCHPWHELAKQCSRQFTGCANNTCAACGPILGPCYDAEGKKLM